jgi:threonine/homoserine/homoserine lactone efflux protein
MQTTIAALARVLPLCLIALGLAFAALAALTQVSPKKGKRRLVASLSVSLAFAEGGVAQVIAQHHLWPGVLGLCGGVFLAWIGFRKQKRDPDGHTPAAQML